MAKPNYSFEKRQRELAKKKKKEEKAREKADRKSGGDTGQGQPADETAEGAPPALHADLRAGAYRLDQVRFAVREPGLFVLTALGSRGITWSALCAEVLAAAISGAPMPLEASLLDAIDPARFAVRARRGADRASRI